MTFSVTQSSWVWYQMKKVVFDIAVSSPLQIWAIVLFVLGNLAKQFFFKYFFFWFQSHSLSHHTRQTYIIQHKAQNTRRGIALLICFEIFQGGRNPALVCFQKFPTLCEHVLHQKMEAEVCDLNPGNHQVMTFLFLWQCRKFGHLAVRCQSRLQLCRCPVRMGWGMRNVLNCLSPTNYFCCSHKQAAEAYSIKKSHKITGPRSVASVCVFWV